MKTLMPLPLLAVTLLAVTLARGEERVAQRLVFPDHDYAAFGRFNDSLAVQQDEAGGGYRLYVWGPPADKPRAIEAYQIDNPPVGGPEATLAGEVRYQDVVGPAYLELSGTFADGTQTSVRTTADHGPAMRIDGTSAARDFRLVLPLKSGRVPARLTLNVVMPGGGMVEVTDAGFVESVPATQAAADAAPPGSAAYVPTDAQVDAELLRENQPLPGLIHDRDEFIFQLTAFGKEYGPNNPIRLRLRALLAGCDRRIAALGGPLLTDDSAPATRPAADARPAAATAEPPAAPSAAFPPLTWGLVQLRAGHLGVIAGAGLFLLVASRGRLRRTAVAFFAVVALYGVIEVFFAGVVTGMGRPPQATAVLLGGAAVLIALGVAGVPWSRRRYATAELRKLRAMDVPG